MKRMMKAQILGMLSAIALPGVGTRLDSQADDAKEDDDAEVEDVGYAQRKA